MKLKQFVDSAMASVGRGGDEILDLDIRVEEIGTGLKFPLESVEFQPERKALCLTVAHPRSKFDPLAKIADDQAAEKAAKLLDDYNHGRTGSFYTALFDAITKADPANRGKLRLAFPFEVAAYEDWFTDSEVS